MSTQDPPPGNGLPWPPPRDQIRLVGGGAVMSAAAAMSGFAGRALMAGIFATVATVLLVIALMQLTGRRPDDRQRDRDR